MKRIQLNNLRAMLPCGKYQYGSEREANKEILLIAKKRNHKGKIPVRAYQCNKCGFWHLTSKPKSE